MAHCSQFIEKYHAPVSPKDFFIVVNAVLSGIKMLLTGLSFSAGLVTYTDPIHIYVGIIFLPPNNSHNKSIRGLFKQLSISSPYVITFWNSIVNNISWNKVWLHLIDIF